MTIRLSSAVLYGEDQPGFDKLISKGWVHPLGIHDEPLERSLVKSFGSLRFQVVRHAHLSSMAQYPTYTEIYVSHVSDDEDKILLKGHGTPFSISELFAAVVWLEEEFE